MYIVFFDSSIHYPRVATEPKAPKFKIAKFEASNCNLLRVFYYWRDTSYKTQCPLFGFYLLPGIRLRISFIDIILSLAS